MKKVETWMPILVDKYLGDTTHLTTEQHGAYLLLLMTCWKRDGRLPAEDAQLAAIARLSISKWRASGPILMAFFSHENGHLTQKRLTVELVRAKVNLEQRSKAGKASAAKRESIKDSNENATTVATNVATEAQREYQRNHQRNVKPIPIPCSEANASAADGGPEVVDKSDLTKQELWRAGKSLLAEQGMPNAQCGTFIGKLAKDYPDAIVDAVRSTVVARPADAASYLKATCMRLKGERTDPVTIPGEPPSAYLARMAAERKADAERMAGSNGPPPELLAKFGKVVRVIA